MFYILHTFMKAACNLGASFCFPTYMYLLERMHRSIDPYDLQLTILGLLKNKLVKTLSNNTSCIKHRT